ncbi:MAG: nitronate monooxygenase [Protaetiibacter sp.]
MVLPPSLSERIALPVVCAPMLLVSSPELVIESRKAGVVGAFPRQSARNREDFEGWLRRIQDEIGEWAATTGGVPGPLAVNLHTNVPDLATELDLCAAAGVDILITALGDPVELTAMAHDRGLLVWHDVTAMRFADKAAAAGVDGMTCIGAGGGGHSGTVSHLALIPKVRRMFDGTIALAGAVATGAAVRAAEILGADLAYVGTRFTATVESAADPRQKEWIVAGGAADLEYTAKVNGVPANWMRASLAARGIDLAALEAPVTRGHEHLGGPRPWRDLWSAGQGIELIDDIPTVAELVARLETEYLAACALPDRVAVVRGRHEVVG